MNSTKLFRVSKNMFSDAQKWKNENGSRRVFWLNRIYVNISGYYRVRSGDLSCHSPTPYQFGHEGKGLAGKK